MLGLRNSLITSRNPGITIVTDNLVLRHDYRLHPVQPLSDGAAAINADADGTDFIDVGLIPITTNDVTISAWVYVTSWVDYAGIISNRHGSSPEQGFAIRTRSGKTFGLITDESTSGSITSTSTAKNDNQWYHVCGVIDRDGSQYLYIDGALEDSDDISALADSLTHATSVRIGKDSGSAEFNGYICNVGYWDRVLTQAEVKSIMWKDYVGLSASEKTSLVSWWNLDSVIPDTTTFVYDNHRGDGNTLGSEIVADGDFALTGTQAESITGTYWKTAAGWTISDEKAHVNYGSTVGLTQTIPLSVGATYFVEFTISNYARGALQIQFGGAVIGSGGADGTFSFYKTSTVTSTTLYCYAMSTPKFSIDNVSVKQVNGNTGTLS